MQQVINLLWPDGTLTSGQNWDEVEQAMRAQQPMSFRSRAEFRAEMRHRAFVWSGVKPKRLLTTSAKAFINQLADHGLFLIETIGDPS